MNVTRTNQEEPEQTIEKDAFESVMSLIRFLRSDQGCPWDREQDLHSLVPCLKEEQEEFLDALARGEIKEIQEELGDALFVLLQMAVVAEEKGLFRFSDCLRGVGDKMTRRHPHVFGDKTARTAQEALQCWREAKARESAIGNRQ